MLFSIIIPYFNENVDRVLSAIEYSCSSSIELLEVILVNNGGTPYAPTKSYPFEINLIDEGQFLNSPYSARNRGVEVAKGDCFIFLDATCLPDKEWFKYLLDNKTLFQTGVLAANIKFYHPEKIISSGNIYDSIINIDNERTVKVSRTAKTACLGISRETFFDVGAFDEGVRSGGDVSWTAKYSASGGNISFHEDWIVYKQSRSTFDLIEKQVRVAKGWPALWKAKGNLAPEFVKKVILCFFPPNPVSLFKAANRRGVSLSMKDKMKLVCLGWVLRLVSAYGVVYGISRKN